MSVRLQREHFKFLSHVNKSLGLEVQVHAICHATGGGMDIAGFVRSSIKISDIVSYHLQPNKPLSYHSSGLDSCAWKAAIKVLESGQKTPVVGDHTCNDAGH